MSPDKVTAPLLEALGFEQTERGELHAEGCKATVTIRAKEAEVLITLPNGNSFVFAVDRNIEQAPVGAKLN